jgi:hypothetical protein
MATGHVVDCDFAYLLCRPLTGNLYEIVNYGLASCPGIGRTARYGKDRNVQHDADISSSPLHRLLHLIKAKLALYSILECPFFLGLCDIKF